MTLALLSVNTGISRLIGTQNGEPVYSAIAKTPVPDGEVFVGRLGIEGDVQADLSAHGGVDKAVYAYPVSHWPWWTERKGLDCRPGAFGENLTLAGVDEASVAIGDRFSWGDVVLEVAQPRGPCYKLDLHFAREGIAQTMTLSARCGWYMRVIESGTAPLHAAFIRSTTDNGPSVRDAFLARHDPRASAALRKGVIEARALAENWRVGVARFGT